MFGENLTLGIVITAALIDSVNPCVLGVLIFLIAFMTRVFNSAKKMLFAGLFYTLVVYVTYLLLGFGILKVALSVGLATAFYWTAAFIAIAAGLFEIKDYFWYGKGFSLQMIPGASERIRHYVGWIETTQSRHPAFLILTLAVLGVFVVLVELPCTGAPYLAILGLLAAGEYASAVPLLLLYNLVFVLPLLIVIAMAYLGTSSERLEAWRKEHRGAMRLFIGIFLICLGFYMIYSLNPVF